MIWFQPRYTRLGSEIPEHIYVRCEYLFLINGIVENEKKNTKKSGFSVASTIWLRFKSSSVNMHRCRIVNYHYHEICYRVPLPTYQQREHSQPETEVH